jgi:glucose/arabinose dehydrogenase
MPSAARRQSAIHNPQSAIRRPSRRPRFEPLENRSLLAGITPPAGLVGWWAAEGTAADWAGDNDGTAYLGASYAAGQVGQAFSFDGVNDRVEILDSDSLELTASLTIEGWIQVNAFPTISEHNHILFRGDDRPGLDPYFLAVTPAGALKFNISGSTGGKRLEGGLLPLGQFAHVAATLDDATGAMRLYVNGNLSAETFTTIRPLADLDPAFNAGVAIGNHAGYPSGGNNYPFSGLIDEVSLYNRALSQEELQSIHAAGLDGDGKIAISISDATAAEGSTTTKFLDGFVPAGSGGLSRPRVIAYGPGGNLYVVSADNDSVLRYDAATGGFIDTFVTSGSGGLDDPWAMTFGPDGNLYVGSGLTTQNVLRFDGTTGAFVDEFIAAGESGLNKTKGLIFGPDGNLYVSNSAGAGGVPGPHNVLRFQGPLSATPGAPLPAPGQSDAVFIADGSGGLNNPNGLAFGPDGNLYVANTFGDTINRYSAADGAFLSTFVGFQSGGLDTPSQMLFRPDGYLYITSQSTHEVLRYSATTGAFIDAIVAAGSAGLDSPCGIVFDAGGNLIVTNSGPNRPEVSNSSLLRYGPASLAAFTVSISSASNESVAVDYSIASGSATSGSDFTAASGTITFAPGQTSRTILIQTLDDTAYEGNETFTVNLTNPVGGVIIDGQGVGTIVDNDPQPTKFYVVDDASANNTFEYSASGTAVENYSLNSGNTAPRGAASTAAGDKVWVVDANRKVYVYDASGVLLGSWTAGSLSNSADEQGIATNGTDVWIVDAKNDRVYRYAGAATRLSGSQNAVSSFALNSGNKNPTDIVTDGTSIWVLNNTSSTDKVFKYTVSGTLLGSWTISSGGGSPTGITIDPTNVSNIWIVDSFSDCVYQFDAAASRTSGSQSPSASFALAPGNTNPQGLADPPVVSDDGLTSPLDPSLPDSSFDSALLAIVGELDGLLARAKKRK